MSRLLQALALLAVRPMTGRLHQIRVHLASLGSPIVGDNAYGGCSLAGSRLFLHCRSVSLKDLSGSPFKPKYPLPEDGQLLRCEQASFSSVFLGGSAAGSGRPAAAVERFGRKKRPSLRVTALCATASSSGA
ncbi:unnamed protein product [Symbiodinium sp. KB8]|nr:unnamed protein product [Symbiodinium sp. KB8]